MPEREHAETLLGKAERHLGRPLLTSQVSKTLADSLLQLSRNFDAGE